MNISVLDTDHLGDDIDFTPLTHLANRYGGRCTLYDNTSDEDFFSHCMSSQILVANRVKFTQDKLKRLNDLKLIAITATGFNSIDIDAAKLLKIGVANVPHYSTPSVTQFTFSSLFFLMNHMSFYDSFVKSGRYSKGIVSSNLDRSWHELKSLTWGIIGMGHIGREVARIAKTFGSHVVYYSTSGKNMNAPYTHLPLLQLLSESDIISVHAPLNTVTRGLLNAETLSRVKKNAILINVGRGGIIDEEAIANMINTNAIGGVVIDVFEREPLHPSNPLLSVKYPERLLLTPHIAWSSIEARRKLVQVVHSNITAFLEGREENRVC